MLSEQHRLAGIPWWREFIRWWQAEIEDEVALPPTKRLCPPNAARLCFGHMGQGPVGIE